MTTKPVIPRDTAGRDVDGAIDYYISNGGARAALGFVDALERAYGHIARNPATGSPRYAHELNIPGLRCWRIACFPHLIFYMVQPDHIDVWRVLSGKVDIPAWMQPDSD